MENPHNGDSVQVFTCYRYMCTSCGALLCTCFLSKFVFSKACVLLIVRSCVSLLPSVHAQPRQSRQLFLRVPSPRSRPGPSLHHLRRKTVSVDEPRSRRPSGVPVLPGKSKKRKRAARTTRPNKAVDPEDLMSPLRLLSQVLSQSSLSVSVSELPLSSSLPQVGVLITQLAFSSINWRGRHSRHLGGAEPACGAARDEPLAELHPHDGLRGRDARHGARRQPECLLDAGHSAPERMAHEDEGGGARTLRKRIECETERCGEHLHARQVISGNQRTCASGSSVRRPATPLKSHQVSPSWVRSAAVGAGSP